MIWLAAIFGFAFLYGMARHRDTHHAAERYYEDGGGDYYCDNGGDSDCGDCGGD